METIKGIAKGFALEYLPDGLLKFVRGRHYLSSLKNYKIESEPDLYGCKELIQPGDTVFDIGANIGVYTRFCSEFAGPNGQVVSFEPIPETFEYLTKNIRGLKLANVKCLNVAASDHDSDSDRMYVPEYSNGGANLYEAKLSDEGNVAVKTVRLDTLFPDLNPSFIKCDVEGHETACIRGAINLIERCRPNWMVEVSSLDTFELFRSFNYKAFYYNGSRFYPFDPARRSANWFFLAVS